jgi:poly(3-hydroxybutyrate) depolymerase
MWYTLLEQHRQLWRSYAAASVLAQRTWLAAGGVAPWFPGSAQACSTDLWAPLLGPPATPPPFGIESVVIGAQSVPVNELVVADTPFCRLRRFARMPAGRSPGPGRAIVLCAPLAGHSAVVMRETVETLLEDGDVYLTDWVNARDVPLAAGPFGLDHYVQMLGQFIEQVCSASRSLHVVAVCQATVPALASLSLLASHGHALPSSLTLIGGPIDARRKPTIVGRFAASHSPDWFVHNTLDTVPSGYTGAGRRVFPAYLQQAEMATAAPRHYWALIAQYTHAAALGDQAGVIAARKALDEYAAFVDMPAEYFLDTINVVFRQARLARGTWRVAGEAVQPGSLTHMSLLSVEGADDDVTGAGQTHAAHRLCGGLADAQRHRLDVPRCDHYGLFSGRRWRAVVHPALQTLFAGSEVGAP